ncbi:high mobility group protein 20A isoform X3 [Rhinolophus ferrumequinum]|uniref:high mobility group protein 20A isoform X3 n=1 Tax=Rhinolophus ferrumequinum TaxID=59479 RepID=UPI00140F8C0C|nr:high mobility group protein 20A isoform X3 [Rhinolophus ferrumequinum]
MPAEFPLPPPHGTSRLPGHSVIHTLRRDLAPLPMQHIELANRGNPEEQDTEKPKKRKGGWPKGKKRKPPRDLSVPRAPTTGYVIFLNEQRSQLRAKHPELPFTEITKMLAAQWAQLSQEKKQRYIYEADEDKQRYIRELQTYQSSEAYRAFLRRQAAHKTQGLCGTGTPGSESESKGLDFLAIDGHGNKDLYCQTCRQFFSSLHNKKEHLLGKQHLQTLTGEFEKDSAQCLKHLGPLEEEEGQNLKQGDSEEKAECPDLPQLGALIPEKTFASLDLCFLQEFIFKLLKIKEYELRELRKTLERAQAKQMALQRQLAEFQNQQQRLEVELAGLKTYGLILAQELENLNVVVMLSHFGLQVVDTGEAPGPLQPLSLCTHTLPPGPHWARKPRPWEIPVVHSLTRACVPDFFAQCTFPRGQRLQAPCWCSGLGGGGDEP